jgi:hypothetical protein
MQFLLLLSCWRRAMVLWSFVMLIEVIVCLGEKTQI